MRKTYEIVSEGYAIAERLVKLGVEHLTASKTPQEIVALLLKKGEQFRASHPDLVQRFNHLVALGHLAVTNIEEEFEHPQPAAPVVEEPKAVAAEDAFTVLKSAVIELGNSIIGYRSPDMAEFKTVSGSLAVSAGVKLKAVGDKIGARILSVLEKEKTIAKE